jgi:hypothetical protein
MLSFRPRPLLNVASGKLPTFAVVSSDGRTASQALQYVADTINDGNSSNDEVAKDIGDDINNAKVVPAGVIPHDYTTIYYMGCIRIACRLRLSVGQVQLVTDWVADTCQTASWQ